MSFGKDPSNLNNVGTYGASMSQRMGNATRRVPRTGGSRPYWIGQYNPSKHGQDTIRILPGDYQIPRVDDNGNIYEEACPWFEFVEHYSTITKAGGICSSGPEGAKRENRKPCEGCDIFWTDWKERKAIEEATNVKPKNPNRISRSSKYVFNVLDMGYFFKSPQRDKDGNMRVNSSTGQPYMEWVKYLGAHQDAQLQGVEQRYGRVVQWALGRDHFGVLNKQADIIGNNCRSCGGQNSLQTRYWSCGNCSNILLDVATAGMDPEQVQDTTRKPMACSHCSSVGYPVEIINCSNCQSPQRTTLFDVNLQVTRQEDANGRSQLLIPGFSQVCVIDATFSDILEKLPNLARKYAPLAYPEQAQKYGAAAPQQPQQRGAPQGQYAQPPPQQTQQPYHPQQYSQQPSTAQSALPSGEGAAPLATPPGYNTPGGYGNQNT